MVLSFEELVCKRPGCGELVRRKRLAQLYCSERCRNAVVQRRKRRKQAQQSGDAKGTDRGVLGSGDGHTMGIRTFPLGAVSSPRNFNLTDEEAQPYPPYVTTPKETNMAENYVQPLQALRAVMVEKRRMLAESLVRSCKGAKAAKRCKKLVKLQREIDVIDDAIADEQLLSPSLREQVAKERTGEVTSLETAAKSMERVRSRLTELGELLTEAGSATVSKPGAR